MVVDVVIQQIVVCSLAILFLSAGVQKLMYQRRFAGALAAYDLIPGGLISGLSVAVPLAELLVGILLLFPFTKLLASGLAAMLLSVFTVAMGVNLWRGRRDIDCGCQFGGRGQSISTGLVVRNLILILAALALLSPPPDRLMNWFDYAVISFGVLMACLLYGVGNTLIDSHARTSSL